MRREESRLPALALVERATMDANAMRGRLGDRVRELRTRQNLSQEDVAGMLGVKQGYVSDVENGRVDIPRLRRLFELSYVLGTDVNDLLMASDWPDVSEAVAELRELEAAVGALSGRRADSAVGRRYLQRREGTQTRPEGR